MSHFGHNTPESAPWQPYPLACASIDAISKRDTRSHVGRRSRKRWALGLAAFAGLAVPLGAAVMLFLLHGGRSSSDGQADVSDPRPASMAQFDASTAAGIDLPHPGALIGLTDAPTDALLFAVGGGNTPRSDEDASAGSANPNGDGYQPGTGAPHRPRHPDHPQTRSPFGLGPHGSPVILSVGTPTGGSRAPGNSAPGTGAPASESPGSGTPETGSPGAGSPGADSQPPGAPSHGTPGTGGKDPEAPAGNGGPSTQNDPTGTPPGGGQPPGRFVPTGNDPLLEPAINPPAQPPVANTVPEPGALALVVTALGLLGWNRRKR